MPEIDGDLSRVLSVCFKPLRWRSGEEGFRCRDGASWKRRVYWKREAASASAFSFEGSQTEEKEKLRQAASIRRTRSVGIVVRDRLRSVSMASTMTLLSM